ncbi:uncharacterized protein LOC129610789 [Condylostylus longicornis]|uniref:uncharacterized protein LOC129610789 n=1 Tax=Condylostylus longicornis TaxID=2530218 RepID=UPI00244E2858|nr:uncharacterized protein LOC129610789 [Condylostylus longicornis]
MLISTSKTKSMTISKHPLRVKLAVYNQPIEQVMEFKYLGNLITSSRDLSKEVKTQSIKAASISGYLRDVIWKNSYMRISSKIRIYKTCVRPVLTYGVETRADTKETQSKMQTVEMQTLRTIAGFTKLDMILTSGAEEGLKNGNNMFRECPKKELPKQS